MKSNLERHICHDKTFGMAFNKESSTYQKMCFAIALFHSSVNERRGYSMCGWNQGHDDSKLHKTSTASTSNSHWRECAITLQYRNLYLKFPLTGTCYHALAIDCPI